MTDVVFALILLAAFTVALALVRHFRTLDRDFGAAAATPMIAGLLSGVLLAVPLRLPLYVTAGILLTLAALYVRLTGRESEPIDGMLMGALTGAAASVPLLFVEDRLAAPVASCILAGAVAGYGITFAVSHVADKSKQLIIDVVTAAAAIAVASLPFDTALPPRRVATAVAIAVPLLAVITVFLQWGDVRRELTGEAQLGFVDENDVRRTAHPLLRLGRAGWANSGAHREFVRLATKLALRKRQQRGRPEEIARLYQLEIIKLRMQIEEMTRIDRTLRKRADGGKASPSSATADEEVPSDTMANR